MTFQPVTDGVECVLNQTYLGNPVANVLHFKKRTVEINGVSLQALAIALFSAIYANMKGLMADTWTLDSIQCTDIRTSTGAQILYPSPQSCAGNQGAGLPGSVAGVISLKTALRGRSYRGRVYMTALAESLVTGNTILSSWTSGMVTFWAGIIVSEALPFDLAVCSRWENGVKRATGIVTPVASIEVDARVDSQRRRTR